MAKLDHPIMHQDSRGGGDGYTHRREKSWRKMGITFNGQFLKWRVFIECVKLQGHRCAVCGMTDASESLSADHSHSSSDFRGALCLHCNHRAVGVVERFGRYRNARYTALVQAYLATPPAMLFRKQLMRVANAPKIPKRSRGSI